MKNKLTSFCLKSFFFILASLHAGKSLSETLIPLTTWISSRSNLSTEDTAYLGARCGVIYNINKSFWGGLEAGKNGAEKMAAKSIIYFSISTRYWLITTKSLCNKNLNDLYARQTTFVNGLYKSYYQTLRDNQPIPFSLSNELLAGDLGVCDSTNETFLNAYSVFEKEKKIP